MAIRYKIVGKNQKFTNAGSFGLKSLAQKKARRIIKARKEAGASYKSIKVKKYDTLKE